MKFARPRLLSLLILSAFSASGFAASTTEPAPSAPSQHDEAAQPSVVSANLIMGNPDDSLVLEGNAEVRRGDAVLTGDTIRYTQKTDEVEASGNATLSKDGASFTAPNMRYRLTRQEGEMTDAEYEYTPRRMRGCAKVIRFVSGDKTTLDDAKLTTCRRDDEAWFIRMNKLTVDEYDKTATGTGATLHFMGVPILGSPWLSFPITNERRSGLLTPTFGMSSTRGVDVRVPVYLNLAPNYDLTLTPRVMSKRGVLLETQTRLLLPYFRGELTADWIGKDRVTKESRNGIHADLAFKRDNVFAGVDYNRVSDNDFINDFSGNIRETSQSVLPQDFWVGYRNPYLEAQLSVEKNQTLSDKSKPYERIPHLRVSNHVGNWNGFEFRTLVDAADFKSDNRVDGKRLIFQQTVTYPILSSGWYAFPRVSWLGSWYDLRHLDRNPKLKDHRPNFTLPSVSMDTGLIFERNTNLFGRAVRQTLEPSVYYAWSPRRDMNQIPFFDTTLADLSYAPLFVSNAFTGADAVNESNQISTLVTTKLFDPQNGREWLRASIGERFYLRKSNTDMNAPGTTVDSGRSDVLASVSAHLPYHVTVDGTFQYAAKSKSVEKVNAGVLWRPRPMSALGLSFRYNNPHTARRVGDWDDDHIKQLDLSVQWPLTKKLYGLARYNYSLNNHRPIEMLAGLEYVHDCWTMRFVAQRYNTTDNRTESSFFLQLELSGLGSIGTSPIKELKRNIQGYQRARAFPEL